ncbi:MAG: 50S ribosomal protein L3 [Magnetococcales bacterium]|nr:50S ribosomal protein L3 [Magnetococcales bacterium]
MRNGLIGRKLGMTQIFSEDGERHAVTVLRVGPCPVIALREQEKDGYNAVQVAFEEAKPSRVGKPERGQFAKVNVAPHAVLKEFRSKDSVHCEVGQVLTVALFQTGSYVDVAAKTVGKGFAGTMKRWGFRGGNATHGAHKIHRSPGSIGQCQTPGRVLKNKKMSGHMGDDRVTAQNLRIAAVDVDKNLLVVKGSVPGAEGSIVFVRDAIKKSTEN